MEKRKRQQDVESGGEILTYMQKVGKNDFYQRIPKSDPSPKRLPNQKEKVYHNIQLGTQNQNQMISQPGKMTKGVKKVAKRAKKVYKQKLTSHFHHCKLRIDKKVKNTPFPKELIPGASMDETNFRLDQVSTNQPLLHSHSSIFHLFLFFRGALTFKEVSPACTQVVQEQLACTHGQNIICLCAHVTVPNTFHIHPQISGKK